MSLSDRPHDQSHVKAFVRAHYKDIPVEARSALGQGVLELFASHPQSNQQHPALPAGVASSIGSVTGSVVNAGGLSDAPPAGAAAASERPPRITWRSFHRVCAAMGLHLSERQGQAAIKQFCSEDAPAASASPPVAGSVVSPFEPGMTFDDFLILYASITKPLSVQQEMMEAWRLLDEHLTGYVPLSTLRATMLGLEQAAPTNLKEHGAHFYDTQYSYGYTAAQHAQTSEQLIDSLIAAHFGEARDLNDTITFNEFVEFMYA
jgi:hypothetical protein